MRDTSLPSPGVLSNGFLIRREAAKAISAVEIASRHTAGGKVASANKLHAFFTACAAAVAGMRDTTVPTVVSRLAAAATATVIRVKFSEGIDKTYIPAASAFVFSPAKTIASMEVQGGTLVITTTAPVANGNTLAYTKPGSGATLRDAAGNEVASWAAAAVTVA